MRTNSILRLAFVLALLVPTAARAQWAANGNPVSTAVGAQHAIQMAADGLGGAVMVWQDDRTGTGDIYARQIDNFGAVQWTANGVPLCTATGFQTNPCVAPDGFGYLFYVWNDSRSGTSDIYGAVTDRLGNIFTDPDGFPICTATGSQSGACLTSNPALGVGYVSWTDARNGNNDIYAQAISADGSTFWPGDGLAFCARSGDQNGAAIASDAPGDGAIVVWDDFRNGNYDIYAQRANLAGVTQWAANGVPVCTQASAQIGAMIVNDGAGGAIIAWTDYRNGLSSSIYAQRIDANGVPQWTAGGVQVCSSSDLVVSPHMVSDGAGGAIVAWEDDRNNGVSSADIYAQRISSSGSMLWTANGLAVCTATNTQNSCSLAPDGAGGAFVTWQDFRTPGPTDIYSQHIDGSGARVWIANGVVISNAVGNQFSPQVVNDGTGASILAWEDRRSGNSDVYAQRIDAFSGIAGHPRPTIMSIADVPGDEGGHVSIQWKPGDGPVTSWQVYRYTDGGTVASGSGNGSTLYTTDAPTTADGVSNSFSVTVTTPTNVYESPQASGTSLDNLAPPAPSLRASQNGPDVKLQWSVTAPDIAGYYIERDGAGDFATSRSPSYVDASPPVATHTYRVRAVDVHGNIGAWSRGATVNMVTGVENSESVPSALTLLPNSPNPFNRSTNLRFGLPRDGDVSLEVFTVAGRRVWSHEAGRLAAGWRDVRFDGRDNAGNLLPSGVYFYRVHAAGEMHSRRMVIGR